MSDKLTEKDKQGIEKYFQRLKKDLNISSDSELDERKIIDKLIEYAIIDHGIYTVHFKNGKKGHLLPENFTEKDIKKYPVQAEVPDIEFEKWFRLIIAKFIPAKEVRKDYKSIEIDALNVYSKGLIQNTEFDLTATKDRINEKILAGGNIDISRLWTVVDLKTALNNIPADSPDNILNMRNSCLKLLYNENYIQLAIQLFHLGTQIPISILEKAEFNDKTYRDRLTNNINQAVKKWFDYGKIREEGKADAEGYLEDYKELRNDFNSDNLYFEWYAQRHGGTKHKYLKQIKKYFPKEFIEAQKKFQKK